MNLPYVSLWCDLWLLQIGTAVMYEALDARTYEYIRVKVTVLHRWGFSFRLYSPLCRG